MSPFIWVAIGMFLFLLLLFTAQWFRNMIGDIMTGIFEMLKRIFVIVISVVIVVAIVYFLWRKFAV